MSLRIFFNRLYNAKRTKQAEVGVRIQRHFDKKKMAKKGFEFADVWYVSVRSTRPLR